MQDGSIKIPFSYRLVEYDKHSKVGLLIEKELHFKNLFWDLPMNLKCYWNSYDYTV